jgi:DNA-binding NarL/FixJ family response regulator
LQTAATAGDRPVTQVSAIDQVSPQERAAVDDRMTMLVCDDRPEVRQQLSRILRHRSQGAVESVADGTDLLDAYAATAPAQVLIGVHGGSTFGSDALDLLLANHPASSPVIYGSRSDIDLLARVYARGAAGLLVWEADHR